MQTFPLKASSSSEQTRMHLNSEITDTCARTLFWGVATRFFQFQLRVCRAFTSLHSKSITPPPKKERQTDLTAYTFFFLASRTHELLRWKVLLGFQEGSFNLKPKRGKSIFFFPLSRSVWRGGGVKKKKKKRSCLLLLFWSLLRVLSLPTN